MPSFNYFSEDDHHLYGPWVTNLPHQGPSHGVGVWTPCHVGVKIKGREGRGYFVLYVFRVHTHSSAVPLNRQKDLVKRLRLGWKNVQQ